MAYAARGDRRRPLEGSAPNGSAASHSRGPERSTGRGPDEELPGSPTSLTPLLPSEPVGPPVGSVYFADLHAWRSSPPEVVAMVTYRKVAVVHAIDRGETGPGEFGG